MKLMTVVSVLTIVCALVLNKWTLERLLAADEYIEAVAPMVLIGIAQVVGLVLGIWLFRNRRNPAMFRLPLKPAAAALAVLAGFGIYGGLKASYIIDPNREFRLGWERIMTNEEIILVLNIKLKNLSADAMNLAVPGTKSRELFAPKIDARPVGSLDDRSHHFENLPEGITQWHVPVGDEFQTFDAADFSAWPEILPQISYFEHAKFKFVTGVLAAGRDDVFESLLQFKGMARLKSGGFIALSAYQNVDWEKTTVVADDGSAGEEWRIRRWDTKDIKVQRADQLMFTEVLSRSLRPEDAKRAVRSIHEELVAQFLSDRENFKKPDPAFHPASWDRHPAVSVVDLDQDGFDDIYVMARWGKNQLFRNRGDGTFVEEAAKWGLDIDSHTNAALFADFDNDGDQDVFLGRSLERSQYLVNENGRFVDKSEALVDGLLPYTVASISAADFNNDGLLDIYFSTYASQLLMRTDRANWGKYVSKEDADTIEAMLDRKSEAKYTNRPGPPNVLLKNIGGGRFAYAADVPELKVFGNTYQSTWADYDGDGDSDLYVANDFMANNLFRNDGTGHFTDVSVATGTTDIGFGMGASWGDFNGDMKQDLYVSNMFSKAGRRILSQLPSSDERLNKMANGNTLFRNDGEAFTKVSSLTRPGILVEQVGWSWGSQFVDFNNDGQLDIYALSGFYTAPGEHELPVDI